MTTWQPSRNIRLLAPLILIAGGTVALFAYLLRRFPYDGLYGQDAFAYYYQARALFDEAVGKTPPANALYSTNGLQHWPVGYHLQIIAGFLFGGEGLFGPRLLTIAMAVGCPVLVYAIFGRFVPRQPWLARLAGGLVAAAMLPLNATYTRMGLSLMSDVPSLFWALIALYCFLKLFPPLTNDQTDSGSASLWWAVGFGASLGIAVLTRYGVAPLVAAFAFYFVVNLWIGHPTTPASNQGFRRLPLILLVVAVVFALVLIPQVAYLATHNPGNDVSDYLSGMNLSNIFSAGSVSVDGTATFPQPMIVFYLLNPFWDTASGYLSILFLPLVILGLASLIRRRSWDLLTLLVVWWLVPALAYASTPYQAQRFTLLYLPAIAITIGLGVHLVIELLFSMAKSRSALTTWALRAARLVLVICLVVGAMQCWRSVRDWVATHAAWQAQDEQLVSLARSVADNPGNSEAQPHVLSFGATAAIYHYTQWPTLELFNTDEKGVQGFVSSAQTNLVVVPVDSLKTQWVGTPLGNLWQWLQTSYNLTPIGQSGSYTIFRLVNSRH